MPETAPPPAPQIRFDLALFERQAYGREYEPAMQSLSVLLETLALQQGAIARGAPGGSLAADLRDANFATRVAAALTALFSDPGFQLSIEGFNRLIPLQRWLAAIFGASPFGQADHILHLLRQPDAAQQIKLEQKSLLKFCLLYLPESHLPLTLDTLWQQDRSLAVKLYFALQSPRFVLSPEAHAKKEMLLGWLPERLAEVGFDDLPLPTVHEVWMHCSYADRADKHAIKAAINRLARDKLLALGLTDIPEALAAERDKPVMLVPLEWFHSGHSIYRTHSTALEALRPHYWLVAVALDDAIDAAACKVFDEVLVIKRNHGLAHYLQQVSQLAQRLQPDLVYYPSVGMFAETVLLINLRLAPIQLAALGHPATTHAPAIDYILAEEDIIGDPACYSEKIVALPRDSLPYRPPADCPRIEPAIREQAAPVRIAVTASAMKLNPAFLVTLRRIQLEAKTPVELHFFPNQPAGLGLAHLQNLLRRMLGDAAFVVHAKMPYAGYLARLNQCDLFANPFPFGNTNGIVDAVRQGLPGVCLSGPEVHSRIDRGLFQRLGLPDWLACENQDSYVQAVLRLVEEQELRAGLSRQLLESRPDEVLFKGNPGHFLAAIQWLRENHETLRAGNERLLTPPATPG